MHKSDHTHFSLRFVRGSAQTAAFTPFLAVLIAILAAGAMGRPVAAGPIDDYGIDFATIGAPGNVGYSFPPIPPLDGRGAVDYEYRLARTEITVGQWFEFVQAYAPYFNPNQDFISSFIGLYIDLEPGGSLNDPDTYVLYPENANLPTPMSWRMAARYCNWLHNGKATDQEAFESGAYDTSTFTSNPDGTYNDQLAHSPDAKYWIPTFDEWIKGMHYDPALNDGAGGWWQYPNSSNSAPLAGLPGVGETNASLGSQGILGPHLDVGSYPDQQSPWGLLDGSGGMREWTEETFGSNRGDRFIKGSSFLSDDFNYQTEDSINRLDGANTTITRYEGLRIASVIPGPSGVWLLALFCLHGPSRRQRNAATSCYGNPAS